MGFFDKLFGRWRSASGNAKSKDGIANTIARVHERGMSEIKSGNVSAGLTMLRGTLVLCDSKGVPSLLRLQTVENLARALSDCGNKEEALRLLKRNEERYESEQNKFMVASLMHARAVLMRDDNGDKQAVVNLGKQALESLLVACGQFEASSIESKHLERIAAIVRTCLGGLAGSKDESFGYRLTREILLRLAMQVARLIAALAYEKALPLAQCAVDLSSEFLNTRELCNHLMNLSVLYEQLTRFAEAEQTLRRGLTLCEQAGTSMDAMAAWFHFRMVSMLLKLMGETRDPEPLTRMESHLAESERLFAAANADDPMVAAGRSAVQSLRIAVTAGMAARCAQEPNFDRVTRLGVQAMAKLESGEYGEAEALFLRILSGEVVPLPDSHPLIATTHNNLGALYQRQGLYRQARGSYQRALQAARERGERDVDLGTFTGNLAIVERLLGNFAASELLFREALSILQTAGANEARVAGLLDNFGTLYEEMGHYEKAISFYQRALDIYAAGRSLDALESSPLPVQLATDLATCLTNLGNAHQHLRELPAAVLYYRRALASVESALPAQHPLVGLATYNLATAHAATGNLTLAWTMFDEAIAISRNSDGPQSVNTATRLLGLGQLLLELGELEKAASTLAEAMTIVDSALGTEHPLGAVVQNLLGRHCVAVGRIDAGFEHFLRAQTIYDRVIEQVFSIGSEAQRLQFVASIQSSAFATWSLMAQHLAHLQSAKDAAFDLALRRKALAAEAAAIQRDTVFQEGDARLGELQAEFAQLRVRIAEAALYGRDVPPQQRSAWIERRDQLEGALARRTPEMASRIGRVDRRAVERALPDGSALVEIVRIEHYDFRPARERGQPLFAPWPARALGMILPSAPGQPWRGAEYLAFVLHAGRPDAVALVPLGDAMRIDTLVAELRAQIPQASTRHVIIEAFTSAAPNREEDGRTLRAALFDPLLPALKECTRLFIAPDGALSCLPFEILPTADGQRLIDRYTISYLGAGRDILRRAVPLTHAPGPPLVIADPDFNLSAKDDEAATAEPDAAGTQRIPLPEGAFERLHGARAEGEQIGALLGVAPLMDEQALETRLKVRPAPRILHLSTHGYFLPDVGDAAQPRTAAATKTALVPLGYGQANALLRSGLALAGANTRMRGGRLPAGSGDGILNGEDVSGLDLVGTELVVLSACETGMGEVRVGEGVFGLRRAFVLAGARTLVMSLWKVPDLQTRELMTEFYRRLQGGAPRAEALRQAQLLIRARYSAPFYWGGFILQGEAGPMALSLSASGAAR